MTPHVLTRRSNRVPTETDSQDITKISYYAHWTKE